jgi:hypothetical protein
MDPYAEGFDELIDGLNSELIIVGLVGLIDPLKPDIPETVRCVKIERLSLRVYAALTLFLYIVVYVVVPGFASSLSLGTILARLSPSPRRRALSLMRQRYTTLRIC